MEGGKQKENASSHFTVLSSQTCEWNAVTAKSHLQLITAICSLHNMMPHLFCEETSEGKKIGMCGCCSWHDQPFEVL